MSSVLVTGGTGTLGRVLVERLRARGDGPRVLSRRPGGPDTVVGDLESGAGITEAVRGVDVVVHAATRFGHDVAQATTLLAALRTVGGPHLVVVSIVGSDAVPLGYYRDKVRVEQLVAASGVPYTVLRATQFHDLLVTLFGRLGRRTPVLPVLAGARFQPVDVHDVADHLAGLVAQPPARRTVELAGPQVETMADLARTWAAATGRRRLVLPVPLPGGFAAALRAGGLTAPAHAEGRTTFAEFLARRR